MADNKRIVGFDDDIRNMLITESRRTGGDPSFLFEILETIIEKRAWEYLKDKNGNPVGSFTRLIESPLPVGCGMKQAHLLSLLDVHHKYENDDPERKENMRLLRVEVRNLFGVKSHGTNQYSKEDITCNVQTSQQGNSRNYRIAVLNRDAPDIADRVINDDISAAAGIRELRKRQGKPERERIAISLIDAESAYKTLNKHMLPDVLEELIVLLTE